MVQKGGEKRGWAMWVWLLQALSGVLLILLVGLHMVAQHFAEGDLLSYEGVRAYLSNPWAFALESLFLVVVLFHALAGVRAILFDLGLSPEWERAVTMILIGVGVVLFAYAVALTGFVVFSGR